MNNDQSTGAKNAKAAANQPEPAGLSNSGSEKPQHNDTDEIVQTNPPNAPAIDDEIQVTSRIKNPHVTTEDTSSQAPVREDG
ncbi:hypothetical protein FRC00_013881, partial [Tulasnella sp. 408]